MKSGQRLTRGLAITGSVLLWTAFAMLVWACFTAPHNVTWFGLVAFAALELSPLIVIGGCVAMLAAVRARSHRLPIGCGVAAVAASIAGAMVWKPSIPDAGWPLSVAAVLVVGYWLGALIAGVAGVRLTLALGTRRP
jgi:hypothetical protein